MKANPTAAAAATAADAANCRLLADFLNPSLVPLPSSPFRSLPAQHPLARRRREAEGDKDACKEFKKLRHFQVTFLEYLPIAIRSRGQHGVGKRMSTEAKSKLLFGEMFLLGKCLGR